MGLAKAFLLIFYCFSSSCCLGQQPYVAHATRTAKFNAITLTDVATGNQFLLDSARIIITALNRQSQQVWKTDAWKDNHLAPYRVRRPVIRYFAFGKGEKTKQKEVIWITYNNSQFGFLAKKTGAFTWLGQD